MKRSSQSAGRTAGFTLIDNMVAIGIIAVGFAALYTISAQCMRVMYSAREEMTAAQALQDRGDSLRTCTWAQITDASYIAANIMNTAANKAPLMKKMTETVTINAYPTAINPAIQVQRSSAGVTSILSQNAAITNGDMVKIDAQISWTTWSGKCTHTQAISTIFAENPR